MSTSKATKVRFVRCPKCWVILPELAGVPVYKCGGCNAVLKAKNRKEDAESVSSEALEHNPTLKDESEHDSEIKDLESSSQKADLSSGETYKHVESEDCHTKCENERFSNEITSSVEINCHEKEETSSEAGENRKAEHDNGGYSNSGSQSPDTQVYSGGSSPVSTAEKPYKEMLLQMSDSLSDRQTETSAKIVSHDPNCTWSTNTAQSAEPTNFNITSDEDMNEAKLSGKLRDGSKSSSTINSPVHDDGSIHSYYGSDGQVSCQHPYLYKRPSLESQRVAEFISNKGRSTRVGFNVNRNMDINVEEQTEARKFSSMSLNEKHGPPAVGDSLMEPIRYDIQAEQQLDSNGYKGFHQVPHFKGWERDNLVSKEYHRNRNSADYDHVGPSNYQHRELHRSSSLYSPEKLDYIEYNQMELLRKVDELRDQLSRSYTHQGKANEKFLERCTEQDEQWRFYHNHKLNGQYYNSRAFRPRKCMTRQCGCSQMSSSGVSTNCVHHADYSDLHCYHEDWQCLHRMEPPNFCREGGMHRARSCYMSNNPYSSSSPQQQAQSDVPFRGCDKHPCSHILRNTENGVEKLRHRERLRTLKRHCRPIAGGAPFIICYGCSELLHIPADFLHSSKRCHRLQCGSCSKVLMFSLHNKIHIVPYSLKSVAPPPSEVDNSHDTSSTRCSSHAHCCPNGDPMSFSEDYGLSTCKSCSTESDPAILSPAFPSRQISVVNKMQPSNTYSKLTEEKKERPILRHSNKKDKRPIVAHKFVGSSSTGEKLSSGSQTGSPLHRLMGYSSPSQMINGPGDVMHSCNAETISQEG